MMPCAITFQSTHPRGVRQGGLPSTGYDGVFQSTHPRGVRRGDGAGKQKGLKFQSTHPRGVRHRKQQREHDTIQFQSTHPRGVRLRGYAPLFCLLGNFNPRTREGCDKSMCHFVLQEKDFNPRTREGCDDSIACVIAGQCISIHAPARGATT